MYEKARLMVDAMPFASLAREESPTIVFLRRQKLMSFLKARKSNSSYGKKMTIQVFKAVVNSRVKTCKAQSQLTYMED